MAGLGVYRALSAVFPHSFRAKILVVVAGCTLVPKAVFLAWLLTHEGATRHELVTAVQRRYARAGRGEKGRILDEFVAATGYHRKWAIELLRHGPPPARGGRGGRPRVYSAVVVGALRTVWEASGELCGKRLAPFLAELVPALEAAFAMPASAAWKKVLSSTSGTRAAAVGVRVWPSRWTICQAAPSLPVLGRLFPPVARMSRSQRNSSEPVLIRKCGCCASGGWMSITRCCVWMDTPSDCAR